MINESWPWKKELKRLARAIETATTAPVPEGFDDFKLERPLFYSAFVMRELIENWKITDSVRDQKMSILEYPANQQRLGVLRRMAKRGDLDREFHMDRPIAAQIGVWDLVSELIHSGYIAWSANDDQAIKSVLVYSFRNEQRRLIEIDIAAYLQLICSIVEDDVQTFRQWLDESGKLRTSLQ